MTPRETRVLVVEDDEALMMGLVENLEVEGYAVLQAVNGNDALELAIKLKPDLVILDVMLPGMSGYEVCKHIREEGLRTPIIMLTARKEEFDRVLGFDLGTDDYVTKPFSIKELLARVKAILRRSDGSTIEQRKFAFGDFDMDLESRTFTKKGEEIQLTRTEFDLLAYFLAHEGKALSRENLMNDVWGSSYFGTQRSLDSFVAGLRKKIEKKASDPKFILTVHGVGYKFSSDGKPKK
jgi:two-component system alkaline phosphatase synthesis response regulator PhoP